MKLFSGFPDGRAQVTPVYNVFFSELCPAIDDLAELKLTLHCFWLFAHSKNRAPFVTRAELRADRTLMQSLAVVDADVDRVLTDALARASERGTLLCLPATGARDDLYFPNTEPGRRALRGMEQSSASADTGTLRPEPADATTRPNIFRLYEMNVGVLTPMLAEELKEAEASYPAEWLPEAFKIAVHHNKRSWAYIRAILERWRNEGRDGDSKKPKTRWDDEYDKFINR